MPERKHRKKSRSSKKHKKRKQKKRSSRDRRHKPSSHKRSKKRSRHHKKSKHRKHSRSKSRKRSRQQPISSGKHPEMTAAAMNENLGNIVLVKNRHKTPQGMKSPVISPGDDFQHPLLAEQQVAGVGQAYPSSTTRTTSTTTTPAATTNIQPGGAPDSQQLAAQQFFQQRQDMAYGGAAPPPQVGMVPLASTTPTTTATSTSGPYGTTYGTTYGTAATTTTVPSTTGTVTSTTAPTTTTTAPSTGSTMSRPTVEKTDEMTKKETSEEKPACDRVQKWKTYVEKTLEGGVEAMMAEFRLIRGHIPPFCTRMGFDANVEKNRFEDVVCMDQTRVRLPCNSYIHASWVSITVNRKAILTQLPLPETSADFWQMVLDTEVQAILLILTHAEFVMFQANCVFPAEQYVSS